MEILENKIAEKYIRQFNVVAWVTVCWVICSIVAFIDRLRLSLLSLIGAVKK